MALAAVALCLGLGYLAVAMGWPRLLSSAADVLLRASVSAGYGLGLFSIVFLLARVFNIRRLVLLDLLVAASLLVCFLIFRSRAAAVDANKAQNRHWDIPGWLRRIIVVSFTLALIAALYSAVLHAIVHPHGEGWDAFAIWNLHARFLFRGGSGWRDAFSPLIPWSHPDYPLLLPGTVAHFWSYLGRESPKAPAIIGSVFTFSTVGVLVSSLARLRGGTPALLGGIALLATPFFIDHGTSQYADVPLSFFYLATIVLICLYDKCCNENASSRSRGLLMLAGMAAGFAAWTKNEGLLFLCALLASGLFQHIHFRHRKNLHPATAHRAAWAYFLISVAPAVLLIAWFKHSVAPPGELFVDYKAILHKVLTPYRYWVILNWYGKEFLRFGHWLLVPGTILLFVFYLLRRSKDSSSTPGPRASTSTLTLTVAGYFVIYLITPYDLYWHLRFSLNRLFLQLWPSVIFLVFLAFPLPGWPKVGPQLSQNEPHAGNWP